MPVLALVAVLLAALTHATWNFSAKKAAGSRHFVWLYSVGSIILYAPVIAWIVCTERPQFGLAQWVALGGTSVLHLGYSLALQAGYRASDLSLVYPIARGSGSLLSFIGAVLLLGERPTLWAILGLVLIVAGILLVAGLTREPHRAPKVGIFIGVLTGAFIAGYTVNDGWAVKTLALSPFIIDFTANLTRVVILTPFALRDRPALVREARMYGRSASVVSVLGPLGYLLVLFAMQIAPVSHVAPARELSTLVGTYFGSRLLREEAAPARMVGATCILLGVVSLAFTY